MNYYKVLALCIISLLSIQSKQFVDFNKDEVRISKNNEIISVVLPFQIHEPYHIQTEKIVDNNLIPTEIHFETPEGYEILGYEFSKAKREILMLDQLKCEVLSGKLEITLELKQKTPSTKPLNLKGNLYYQACDDRQCFYPRTLHFNLKL